MNPSRQNAALDLLAGTNDAAGRLRLQVSGGSMAPLLLPGDVVWVERVQPGQLHCGDLLVIRREAGLVTHRLVYLDAAAVRTKGDASPWLDPPASFSALLGRVIWIERDGQTIDLQTAEWQAANRRLGRLAAWETAAMRAAYQVKTLLLGRRSLSWTAGLARLLRSPFTLAQRRLLRRPELKARIEKGKNSC
jgi:hypothetical protein